LGHSVHSRLLYVVDHSVCGVTYLDNIMYVVCENSSTIRLYNTDTLSPLDVVINVTEIKHRHDRQLYIADDDCIWRVSVDDHSSSDTFHGYTSLSLDSQQCIFIATSSECCSMHLPKWLHHTVETLCGAFGTVQHSFRDIFAPDHLSSDSEGHVLVADWLNHRILLLKRQLQLQRVLVDTNSQVKLWWPTLLCYNQLASQSHVLHSRSSAMLSHMRGL